MSHGKPGRRVRCTLRAAAAALSILPQMSPAQPCATIKQRQSQQKEQSDNTLLSERGWALGSRHTRRRHKSGLPPTRGDKRKVTRQSHLALQKVEHRLVVPVQHWKVLALFATHPPGLPRSTSDRLSATSSSRNHACKAIGQFAATSFGNDGGVPYQAVLLADDPLPSPVLLPSALPTHTNPQTET